MKRRTPRWECKLWSYLSKGDGVRCPLFDSCQSRQICGCRINDCVTKGYPKPIIEDSQDAFSDYGFTSCSKPGRIIELLEMLTNGYLRAGGIRQPPVPTALIRLIDSQRDMEVRQVPLNIHHGATWCLHNCWVIQINAKDSPDAQRITLFHEAFHILAYCRGASVLTEKGISNGPFNDLLAEQFAIRLLMPTEWIKGKWAEVEDLQELAEIFNVPQSVAYFRLRWLGLV